jgi:hypothetical protein
MLGNILAERAGKMGASLPTVWLSRERESATGWRGDLEREAMPFVRLRVDSEAWFGWLEEEGTTSFRYPLSDAKAGYIAGFMTVRKERRARGGRYWVAYRRCQGRLRKVYLGASLQLTQERLERLAQRFLAASQGREPLDERRTEFPIRKGGGEGSLA